MALVKWRTDPCITLRVLILSLVLLVSPALHMRSLWMNPRSSDGGSATHFRALGVEDWDMDFEQPAFLHGRELLGQTNQGGFAVELVHRHHPSVLGRHMKFKESEHLMDRILLDRQRQMMLQQQLLAKVSRNFDGEVSDSNISAYQFVSPVVSGSTLGSGQYFIDFYLGTPPQHFSLIADTGSDVIWLQCSPCISCYSQIGPAFSSQASSTYTALTCTSQECQYVPPPLNATCDPSNPGVCDYTYGYSDGSTSTGVYGTDTATMNVSKVGQTAKIQNVAFGCGFQNWGPSLTAAGGVIGLGQGPLSFPSQIGSYFGNQFSYCLVNYLDAPTIKSTLIFGSVGTKIQEESKSTPFIVNQYLPSLYYIGIQCVSVGGNKLPIPSSQWQIDSLGGGGTVVDSGTTLTIFLQPAYLVILNAFVSLISCYTRVASQQMLDFCFDTSSVESSSSKLSRLPSLSIAFDSGAVFKPPNENIFVAVTTNIYCLAIAGSVGPFGNNVLGNLIQQNFEITYDRENQMFSFAPAQCS